MRIIAGTLKGRRLKRPPLTQTRPTAERIRESIFNVLAVILENQGLDFDHMNVLDTFAGSGALGFEALSRGAMFVTFIECDRQACDVIYENGQHLKSISKISILQGDARYPKTPDKQYHLIFMDPPYGKGLIMPALEALKKKGWIADRAILVMEFSSDEKPPQLHCVETLMERTYGSSQLLIGQLV
jgi:16S rRNA (guanine966-N2)-methyltransferase